MGEDGSGCSGGCNQRTGPVWSMSPLPQSLVHTQSHLLHFQLYKLLQRDDGWSYLCPQVVLPGRIILVFCVLTQNALVPIFGIFKTSVFCCKAVKLQEYFSQSTKFPASTNSNHTDVPERLCIPTALVKTDAGFHYWLRTINIPL